MNLFRTSFLVSNIALVFHRYYVIISLRYLKDAVGSALRSFAIQRVETVAFPAVGTGGLKYGATHVVNAMVDGITSYLESFPNTSIQKVYLVVYLDDELCYQVINFMRLERSNRFPKSPNCCK